MEFKLISVKVLDIHNASVFYLCENEPFVMPITYRMVIDAFPISKSGIKSLGSAKTITHILGTVKINHKQ